MSGAPDVTVLGGGAIGLCAAEALQRRGAQVQVVEAGRCGAQASAGNAGWITPGISNPLPAPGSVAQALRWMLDPESPFLVHPRLSASFLRWSYAFWRSTTSARYSAGMAALVALGTRAVPAFDALREAGVAFEMHADGLLFVSCDEHALDVELGVLRDEQALGFGGRVEPLDAAAVHEAEPMLAPAVVGGILASDERHVRPETLTAGLTEHLRAQAVTVREHAPVRRIVPDGAGWAVHLDGEVLRTERVVVALGAQSADLLRPLGIHLPLEGAKGYSVTHLQPTAPPSRPLYLLEAKVGVTPYDGAVRFAGTLELGSRDLGVDPRRVRALDTAAARYLPGWSGSRQAARWAGLRPVLPDGLPAVGPVPGHDGAFVATGHAMLGITLAPATAEALAPAVLSGTAPLDLAAFSLARFGNRAPRGGGRRGRTTTAPAMTAPTGRDA